MLSVIVLVVFNAFGSEDLMALTAGEEALSGLLLLLMLAVFIFELLNKGLKHGFIIIIQIHERLMCFEHRL